MGGKSDTQGRGNQVHLEGLLLTHCTVRKCDQIVLIRMKNIEFEICELKEFVRYEMVYTKSTKKGIIIMQMNKMIIFHLGG
jgi:hypothetical protein